MKTIAIFLPWMEYGGAERVMLNLARGLVERGYPVHLVLAKATGGLLKQVPASVRIVDLNAPRALAAFPALVHYLRIERPSVMLSGLPYINLLAIWTKMFACVSTRIIISDHNALSMDLLHSRRFEDKIIAFLAPLFYPCADGMVAVSAGVADDVSRLFRISRTRINIIYNPTITPELSQLASQPLEHDWFMPNQPPVILSVGRLTPQKDHATLLRAFALLNRRHPARLIILGDGELRPVLEEMVRDLRLEKEVRLPGFVDNPFNYMARSKVFVLSSAWEGFGNVLTEALACGLQVVSTDCPSGPAEILKNGEYGRLVPVNDPQALASAIEDAINRPISVEKLLTRAEDFSIEKITAQYLEVLFPATSIIS